MFALTALSNNTHTHTHTHTHTPLSLKSVLIVSLNKKNCYHIKTFISFRM